ncbi:MAG: hypothetical protein FWC60_07460 [Firmicutes bacterium]|nr:hypothetical protein [Bacillota bacterium]
MFITAKLGLGNILTDKGDFPRAEEKYISARDLATQINDDQGRKQALDALNAMHEKQQQQAAQDKEEAQKLVAADLVAQGEKAYQQGDLVNAKMYYSMAKEKYTALQNDQLVLLITQEINSIDQEQQEKEALLVQAGEYMSAGDRYRDSGAYAEAKKQYLLARGIYASLNEITKLSAVRSKIDIIDSYLTGTPPSVQPDMPNDAQASTQASEQ